MASEVDSTVVDSLSPDVDGMRELVPGSVEDNGNVELGASSVAELGALVDVAVSNDSDIVLLVEPALNDGDADNVSLWELENAEESSEMDDDSRIGELIAVGGVSALDETHVVVSAAIVVAVEEPSKSTDVVDATEDNPKELVTSPEIDADDSSGVVDAVEDGSEELGTSSSRDDVDESNDVVDATEDSSDELVTSPEEAADVDDASDVVDAAGDDAE
ncbi:uncharacterized protein AB675_5794 [Cyphellophora attinorum]|uniref:Uncharacterized protein n=1 Tax=Cyphellophora attinorum TaxID=1664694 RepID=A0A0N0NL11_9EURO|nr:uncharacterized protein AB675_5794 [Phialophora attinorum]KPI38761.1 hypothetical protein AB675_5794 [Phialophora attinorum]